LIKRREKYDLQYKERHIRPSGIGVGYCRYTRCRFFCGRGGGIDVLQKNNFGGSGDDYFESVIATSDGGFVAVGHSDVFDGDWAAAGVTSKGNDDATIVKFNSSGAMVWAKNFGGTGGDYFNSVTSTSDGGFVAVGYSSAFDGDWAVAGVTGKGNHDATIVKFNSTGSMVWAKNFGGTGWEYLRSVTATSDGGFVAVGDSDAFDGDWAAAGCVGKGIGDATIVKFNSSGTMVWAKNFGGSNSDYFNYITTTSDGGFVAVGWSETIDVDWAAAGLTGKGNADATIVKFNSTGGMVWAKNFGGTNDDSFRSVTTTSDGGFVAVGYSVAFDGDWAAAGVTGKGFYDATIVKFDSTGGIVWAKNFGGSDWDCFNGVTMASDGGFVAVGESYEFDGDWAVAGVTGKGNGDATIVKFNSTGGMVWAKNFGGSDWDDFLGVTMVSDGGFVAVGYSQPTSFGNGDWVGKTGKGNDDKFFVKFGVAPVKPFVPVRDITDVPSSGMAGMPMTLKGTVTPTGADNRKITWSIKESGATGARLSGNVLTVSQEGMVVVTATVANGKAVGTPFVKDFSIYFSPAPSTGPGTGGTGGTGGGGGGGSDGTDAKSTDSFGGEKTFENGWLYVGIFAVIAVILVVAVVLIGRGK